ncbi:MAG: Nudix family hydrolase [Methylococcaceae bacterium]|nr:Nudix family hydrolase [Methylococcaceae bacterium]
MKTKTPLHVAVGVIKDREGNILISLRHQSSHQGGLWEFPGGKVELNESVEHALTRELKEELGIAVQALMPLIKIKHQYTDVNVLLDVWTVTLFLGNPLGCEGQKIKWVSPERLIKHSFPKANYPIITAARLPTEYAILNGEDEDELLIKLKIILNKGIKLIQARIKAISAKEVKQFFKLATPLCEEKGAYLLVNSAVKCADKVNADGIHLTSQHLLALKQKPTGYKWVAASCHNSLELQHAEQIGVDFVVLAPVLPTKTHPGVSPLGWDSFKILTNNVNLPVFALGGMQQTDKPIAQKFGAQGISGITTFLSQ